MALKERTGKRNEAQTVMDELRTPARALEDERDGTRRDRDAARTERYEERVGLDELEVAAWILEDELDTARKYWDAARTEPDQTVEEYQKG